MTMPRQPTPTRTPTPADAVRLRTIEGFRINGYEQVGDALWQDKTGRLWTINGNGTERLLPAPTATPRPTQTPQPTQTNYQKAANNVEVANLEKSMRTPTPTSTPTDQSLREQWLTYFSATRTGFDKTEKGLQKTVPKDDPAFDPASPKDSWQKVIDYNIATGEKPPSLRPEPEKPEPPQFAPPTSDLSRPEPPDVLTPEEGMEISRNSGLMPSRITPPPPQDTTRRPGQNGTQGGTAPYSPPQFASPIGTQQWTMPGTGGDWWKTDQSDPTRGHWMHNAPQTGFTTYWNQGQYGPPWDQQPWSEEDPWQQYKKGGGFVLRRPATIIDNATGRALASLAEVRPEMISQRPGGFAIANHVPGTTRYLGPPQQQRRMPPPQSGMLPAQAQTTPAAEHAQLGEPSARWGEPPAPPPQPMPVPSPPMSPLPWQAAGGNPPVSEPRQPPSFQPWQATSGGNPPVFEQKQPDVQQSTSSGWQPPAVWNGGSMTEGKQGFRGGGFYHFDTGGTLGWNTPTTGTSTTETKLPAPVMSNIGDITDSPFSPRPVSVQPGGSPTGAPPVANTTGGFNFGGYTFPSFTPPSGSPFAINDLWNGSGGIPTGIDPNSLEAAWYRTQAAIQAERAGLLSGQTGFQQAVDAIRQSLMAKEQAAIGDPAEARLQHARDTYDPYYGRAGMAKPTEIAPPPGTFGVPNGEAPGGQGFRWTLLTPQQSYESVNQPLTQYEQFGQHGISQAQDALNLRQQTAASIYDTLHTMNPGETGLKAGEGLVSPQQLAQERADDDAALAKARQGTKTGVMGTITLPSGRTVSFMGDQTFTQQQQADDAAALLRARQAQKPGTIGTITLPSGTTVTFMGGLTLSAQQQADDDAALLRARLGLESGQIGTITLPSGTTVTYEGAKPGTGTSGGGSGGSGSGSGGVPTRPPAQPIPTVPGRGGLPAVNPVTPAKPISSPISMFQGSGPFFGFIPGTLTPVNNFTGQPLNTPMGWTPPPGYHIVSGNPGTTPVVVAPDSAGSNTAPAINQGPAITDLASWTSAYQKAQAGLTASGKTGAEYDALLQQWVSAHPKPMATGGFILARSA